MDVKIFFLRNGVGITKKWPQILAQGAMYYAHL
jgi:hypothetical protein